MGFRTKNEPPYPQTQEELDAYCARLIAALQSGLGKRLECVLLCGSWARGEAQPPDSDADITIVIDTLDGEALDALKRVWKDVKMGCANVYGADEVPVMSRVAAYMYTTTAIVLYGKNPFMPPTKQEFVEEVALAAESLAREARSLELEFWLTPEERAGGLGNLLAKWGIKHAFEIVAAFRSGVYPRDRQDFRSKLSGSPEGAFLEWLDQLSEQEKVDQTDVIARRLSLLARDWFREIAPYRVKFE
ncbi:MAG: hypothetical protein L0312_23925 [Acidobacteria bacterium]|nr:hypothetical protein [Acidobacteriota bacterium]